MILYVKYLFLGVLENEENSIRKGKFIHKTKDYMVSLSKMFARYSLIKYSGYNVVNWNNLVHASDKEFFSIFVRKQKSKSYQIFSNTEEVKNWLEQVSINDLDLNMIKSLEVNREIIAKYEVNNEKNGWTM